MSSLIDRDATAKRETQYPETAGNALKQITQPILEAHAEAGAKYIDWVQEMLKREDVSFVLKMQILGGQDPMTIGGTLPAIMMAKLQQLGVTHSEISGGMTVSESNKASEVARTAVQSNTNAGVGTPFWHVNEQLNVQHGTKSTQSRDTDYRARIDWKVEMGPMGEAEGVGLIKDAGSAMFQGAQKLIGSIADAQLAKIKKDMGSSGDLPTSDSADEFLGKTDEQLDDFTDGGDSDTSSDDSSTAEEESGD